MKNSSEVTLRVPESVQGLVRTFTEMMTGEATPENIEAILEWAVYMHIRSVMPPLVAHWSSANPSESEQVKQAIHQVKALNEEWKAKRNTKPE